MRKLFLLAACLPVAALLTAGQAAADPGPISGVVTAAATGQPVPGACVTLFDLDLAQVGSGCAGDDGHYEIPGVTPGYYKVRATATGYSELWAYNKGSALAAESLSLPHALDFALRQGSGVVRGRITDQGKPAAGASVSITDVNQHWWSTVRTAADGTYEFTGLTPDTYTEQVVFGDRTQWIRQKSSFPESDSFSLADNATKVVDEEVVPYASLRVIATDEKTGAPVADACSQVETGVPDQPRQCAGADGVMLFKNLPPFGYYYLSTWAAGGTHWSPDTQHFTLTPGQTLEIKVPMRPAAALTTIVRDAKTKAPLTNVCVEEHKLPVEGVIDRDYLNHCSDENGKLLIGPIDPGSYQFLVKPQDEKYGMQWVGAFGGTGDQRQARVTTALPGRSVGIPPIEMDPAGTITGKITDKATGAAVNGVCVFPYAVDPRLGFRFGDYCSHDGGTYTVKGLGPYAWPVEFADSRQRYAWQFSGGAADRFAAAPVTVKSGAAVTANAALVPGGSIKGRLFDKQGQPAFGYVYAYNAKTGDIVQWATPISGADYTVTGLATQQVKIRYYVDAECWHRNAADFRSATPVSVTAGKVTEGVDLGPCTR